MIKMTIGTHMHKPENNHIAGDILSEVNLFLSQFAESTTKAKDEITTIR